MRTVRIVQLELQRELGIERPKHDPQNYISRYLSELYNDAEIELEVQTTIDDMVIKLDDKDLDSPNSDAAALIWMAGQIIGHPKKQKGTRSASPISEKHRPGAIPISAGLKGGRASPARACLL